MGDKIRAKAHVAAAGVPVTPGVALDDAGEDVRAVAERVGFPLLVKPSAGGGGKGMTRVDDPEDLADALATSRRVAAAAFGDGTLLLERFVTAPRHIEVQVLADAHGSVVHLGERECSLQRRHQKVVEEAPSPLLDEATRARIGQAACDVARSVGYLGAGTVEFIVSDDAPDTFFFMEMNTRLQVEHPVTELVTGLDLVECQLRVAAGRPLGFTQRDVRLTGHAVEARVYAEDPQRGFLPTAGRVRVLDEPAGEGVRVDSALRAGLEVGPTYDPMLAKVVAWGADRATALARLDAALARTTVLGVRTNVAFLRRLLADVDVRAGRLDTGLIERSLPDLTVADADRAPWIAATLWRHLALEPDGAVDGPWRRDGWRIGDPRAVGYGLATGDDAVELEVLGPAADATVTITGEGPVHARLTRTADDAADLELDGVVHHLRLATDGPVTWVGGGGATLDVRVQGRLELAAARLADRPGARRAADPAVRSPMPGVVVAVDVATGDHVVAGQPLLAIEAMKMEHRLVAPHDGVVTLRVRPSDRVTLDDVVAVIAPSPHEGHERDPHEGNQQ
jgi:acetyl-CoA/propionyl-CoA carboxylase biotin carboxyl carrier protein